MMTEAIPLLLYLLSLKLFPEITAFFILKQGAQIRAVI